MDQREMEIAEDGESYETKRIAEEAVAVGKREGRVEAIMFKYYQSPT